MTQWTFFAENYSSMVDLDVVDDHYEGMFTGQGVNAPVEIAFIKTADLAPKQRVDAHLVVVMPGTRQPLDPDEIKSFYPNGYQSVIPVEFELGAESLEASVYYDAGRQDFRLPNPRFNQRSDLAVDDNIVSWDQFTRHCSGLPEHRFVFRGQGSTAKLRTSFHRTGRSNLYRYSSSDLKAAYRALSGKTRHVFNAGDPEQHAAFLNLLQHHGFPTPLLDWSESPFIAAYFAFARRREPHEDMDAPVRVLVFNRQAWEAEWAAIQHLTHVSPHVTMLYPLSIENPRAAPQQAVSMVTNLDDIEAYMRSCENMRQSTYLTAIDLPYAEREEVLKDLAMMGITQGTLFPGIDGTCTDLRHRFFGRH